MRGRRPKASPHRRTTPIHRGLGPTTGWREGGPLCPFRWALFRRSPTRWADKDRDRPTARPGDNRLSARERHPSRPCPEGTFFDSPGFVRSTTLGSGSVQRISPEGASLIGVSRESVERILACFGGGHRSLPRRFQPHPATSEPPWGSTANLGDPYPG
jgi:hypothetical protein